VAVVAQIRVIQQGQRQVEVVVAVMDLTFQLTEHLAQPT
tara:strand:+ start:558 stop:674 length:117 start_codon:yes stop_codon:yes gene_type:complete